MNRSATQSNIGASSSSRRYRYTKVLDNRKHPIRGLWKRNGNFVARLTVEDEPARATIPRVYADLEEMKRKILINHFPKLLIRPSSRSKCSIRQALHSLRN